MRVFTPLKLLFNSPVGFKFETPLTLSTKLVFCLFSFAIAFSLFEYELIAAETPITDENIIPAAKAAMAMLSSFANKGSSNGCVPVLSTSSICLLFFLKIIRIAPRHRRNENIASRCSAKPFAEDTPIVVSRVISSPIPPAESASKLLSCSNLVLYQAVTPAA